MTKRFLTALACSVAAFGALWATASERPPAASGTRSEATAPTAFRSWGWD
ncbi:hypothetical protein QWJ26_11945 [Streptomyces sp. CSDS2]|nr:hypothetical protein [Streptomyces sp. CSDS2]MDN3260513.1 hypothetical protein [Streptomyces sp. CSDS2]